MKRLIHPMNIPRSLESRYQKPVCNPTKAWGKFKGKKDVQEALIPVQKYLCSYCEIELARGEGELGYHIEHIEPKTINRNLTFKFNNLLISCFNEGAEVSSSNDDPKPISCGHADGKRYGNDDFDPQLFIKPTAQDCESYFYYELDGRIVPHPNLTDPRKIEKAWYTIKILNLDCRRLNREREDIIIKGFEIINDLIDSPDSLLYFAELELAEINNKNFSFITTRRQYFQDLIN